MGDSVGFLLGIAVGGTVGDCVGFLVGDLVGALVGDSVSRTHPMNTLQAVPDLGALMVACIIVEVPPGGSVTLKDLAPLTKPFVEKSVCPS